MSPVSDIRHYIRAAAGLCLAASGAAHASDGVADSGNEFPAAAGYYEFFV